MKRKFLFLVAFLLLIISIPKVNAARDVCTKSYYSQMKSKAYQVSFNYDLHTSENEPYYFTISITNIQPGIVVQYGNATIKYEEGKQIYELSYIFDGGTTYEFYIYADEGYPCVGEHLYTKKISIPKYNKYSERDECIEYEEFPLCNKWYQKDINSLEDFLQALELYKKSLEKDEPEDLDKEDKSIFDKIIEFYKDHIIITGPLTVLIIGGAGYYGFNKYQKRKKRAKIDIK